MLTIRTFLTSKKGEELDDCQDSIHPFQVSFEDTTNNVFAVSDGTTTSFFSRAWSAILTRHFAENPERAFTDWDSWLRSAQAEWQAEIEKIVHSGKASFFAVNGFRAHKPAAATFVGLSLGEQLDSGRSWRALALGDSCLFLLPASGQPTVMNLRTSEEFSSVVETAESWPRPKDDPHRPTLRQSAPEGNEPLIVEHDAILLASDALSKWMLRRHEQGRSVWGSVLELDRVNDFNDFVERARIEAEDELENDDVALAVLKFGDPHPIYQQHRFNPNPAVQQPPVETTIRGDDPSREPAVGSPPPPVAKTTPSVAPPYAATFPIRPKPKRRVRRFLALLALSTLSLAGVLWMGVSLNRSRDQARLLQIEVQHLHAEKDNLSADKNRASALAAGYHAELQAAITERDATEREAQKDAKLRRESQDQIREFEGAMKADKRKIGELERENAALKEQLAKFAPPPTSGDTPATAPK